MNLPYNLKVYSAPCSSPEGSITVSLRFLLTEEEFAFAQQNGIVPQDATEVIEMGEVAVHDLHMFPTQMQ